MAEYTKIKTARTIICDFCNQLYPDEPEPADGDWMRMLEEDAVPVPQWISVKDRLPENGEYVLCWYEYFRYGDFNAMFAAYGIGYCYNGHWGGEVANGTKARVLAWMPLPEPPKGEAE